MSGVLKRWFKRLSADEGERRAQTIRAWAADVDGAIPIADVEPRSVACIAGVVEGLRVKPREGLPTIEATIGDGTGSVTAVWLGRRSIPGLSLGTRIVLRGRFGGARDRLQLMNPAYDFAPQEH